MEEYDESDCMFCDDHVFRDSCNVNVIELEPLGQPAGTFNRVPYGAGHIDSLMAQAGARCVECNVLPGGYHHAACFKETCPVCGCQLAICDCYKLSGEYEDDPDDDLET